MRNYATLSPLFWTSGTGKRLRENKDAQIIALYLMSAPATTMVGIFPMAIPTICHQTGLSAEDAAVGLKKCIDEGFCFWDESEELIFVPSLAKYQVGEKLKPRDLKIKGIMRALSPFKNHRFYDMFVDIYGDLYSLPIEENEAPSKPLARDYDPDPDLIPYSDQGSKLDPESVEAKVQEVFEFWKQDTGHTSAKLDDKRSNRIKARLQDFTVDQLKTVVRNRKNDPWLMGITSDRVYDGIETLFRDVAQVERLLELETKTSQRGNIREQIKGFEVKVDKNGKKSVQV